MATTETQATEAPAPQGNPLSKLKSIGIRQAKHLPLFIPRAYDDYTVLHESITPDLKVEGTIVNFFCTVVQPAKMVKDKYNDTKDATPPRFTMELMGADGRKVTAISFGKLFGGNPMAEVAIGQKILMKAKVGIWNNDVQLNIIELVPAARAGKIVPVYPSKKGVASGVVLQELIQKAIGDEKTLDGAVNDIRHAFNGLKEEDIIENAGAPFTSVRALLQALHDPYSMDEAEAAIDAARRISICEILWRAQRSSMRQPCLSSSMAMVQASDLIERLPYIPTDGQFRAITEIMDDIGSPYPMQRLLSGDVGSGKTVSYAVPAMATWLKGGRVAIMIPNQLLMTQVANEIKAFFPEVDIKIVCSGADLKKIDLSTNPMLIGTTSLVDFILKQKTSEDMVPWRPDLLIVDEQQKLSREQRESIMDRGTNYLECTATCLPRTAALVSHGGMKVSIINEFPVEKHIRTHLATQADRGAMFKRLQDALASGQQAAIIYPKVEGTTEKDATKSVEMAYQEWNGRYPGRVAMLHGKMKDQDKLDVMARMKSGDFSLLISSTVVEIGVTIPALRFLAVVHSERYGTSTLHQLRGRVARNGGEGDFYMYVPEEVGDESMERLKLLVKYNDGFVLAEKDMEMRGFGDVSGDGDDQAGMSASGAFLNMKITPTDMMRFHVPEAQAAPAEFAKLASGRRKIL